VDAYTVADAALTYRSPLPGTTLQLIVNNLFDHSYEDPGRDADNIGSPVVPQPGRRVYFKVIYSLRRMNSGTKTAATP
jgi:outer membrane receptor protein involved in Fe transport